jgi:hypothetical protein
MKKQLLIENPLFENLLKKAEKYQPLYKTLNEQESPEAGKKDTVDKPKEEKKPSDLEKILNEIIFGAYAVMNSSIISFPASKYKDGFSSKFNSALQDLSSDTSPKILMDKISKTFDDFVSGAMKDPGIKGLEDAYKDYQSSMALYKEALVELEKQEPDKIGSEETKKALGDKLTSILNVTKDTLANKGATAANESFINESLESKRSGKFVNRGNLVSFVNNCKSLVSQIQAKLDQVSTYKTASPNLKTPSAYEAKFTELLNRANELTKDAKSTRKEDGKKTKDQDLITKYNDLYTEIKGDLEESSKQFDTKIKDERISYLKGLKYAKASEVIGKAVEAKNSGDQKVNAAIAKAAAEASVKKEGSSSDGLQIKEPIKRSAVKGKKDPDVEAFQKLVLDKFKGIKKITDNPLFQKFAKYGADGLFGNSTAGIIQGLKAGFGLKDTSSDITAELVDKIKTEKIAESRIQVLKFSDFENLTKSVMEEFDFDAFKKTIEQGGARGDEKPASKSSISSAIKNSGTDKKISQEEIKKEIEKGIEKFKSDLSREEIIKKLVKIDGIKKNDKFDGEKSYAIGLSDGMSFFDNGRALRRFDKVMGTYDIEKDEFKGDDGSVDKLSKIVKDVTPEKYGKKCKELYNDLYLGGARNKKLYTDLLGWSTESMKLLAQAYKDHLASKNKSSNLYDDLLDEWTSTDEINKLVKKFGSVLEG